MNILFLLRTLDLGGVEIVTTVLANKFAKEGHSVSVFSFKKGSGAVINRFDERVDVYICDSYKCSLKNVKFLRKIFIIKQIEIVINQWGLPLVPIRTIFKAKNNLNIKVISVYHNDPIQNGRINSIKFQLLKNQNIVSVVFFRVLLWIVSFATSYSFRYIYSHSDFFEVLSPYYVSNFRSISHINNLNKLIVQSNPVTIDCSGYTYDSQKKYKEIIYVGRLDSIQKKVNRVIEMWAQLEHIFPLWKLTIVGDGPQKTDLIELVSKFRLKHVLFAGLKDVRPFYERASILVLTSDYEGFPLVLNECMSFGVVPVVYGSFAAINEIIEDNVNGLIVNNQNGHFCLSEMVSKVKYLMDNDDILKKMASYSLVKSSNYSLNSIYKQWMHTFNELVCS
ncbi:Glycosyltransferase involved in cell wall bisynthesis [Succinivibrio dextrinosolvens]|uniref:glycosyltransferase n=1 Tax=Succinivibrio dextrinosolvens TaxID=83771 RepID=UPI0008E8D2B1|nr:glycosyltransferase [Succinivibrio dextrinosolvens]SFS83176.1 Glycosyltransferase involved in cell wall bisynthesis [Succinivibrio dextrinosolvens]